MTTATTPRTAPKIDYLGLAREHLAYGADERARANALMDIALSLCVIAESLKAR